MTLHEDFAELSVRAGEARITARPELFHLLNLVEYGGDVHRPTHVPTELGRVGNVALWESTGAADHLPFWNTNYDGDAYLYLVHGSVRVEFKDPLTDERYGHYLGRTGDLLRLPANVAHRTYSGDGKRRITLEILPYNPFWDLDSDVTEISDVTAITDATASGPAGRASSGAFTFDLGSDAVAVSAGGHTTRCPRDEFGRGLRALVKHRLHLGRNEFDGGFVVHDLGATVLLALPGYEEELPAGDVLAAFIGIVGNW